MKKTSLLGGVMAGLAKAIAQSIPIGAAYNAMFDDKKVVRVSDYNATAKLWEMTKPDMRPGLMNGYGDGTARRVIREAARRTEIEALTATLPRDKVTRQQRRAAYRKALKIQLQNRKISAMKDKTFGGAASVIA